MFNDADASLETAPRVVIPQAVVERARYARSLLIRPPDRREVLRLALLIEHHGGRVRRWFRHDAIVEFGNLTPQELCDLGLGGLLITYLRQIMQGVRG